MQLNHNLTYELLIKKITIVMHFFDDYEAALFFFLTENQYLHYRGISSKWIIYCLFINDLNALFGLTFNVFLRKIKPFVFLIILEYFFKVCVMISL